MLRDIADYADGTGVTLILEAVTVMESNVVVYLDDIIQVLELVGRDNVKSMLDTVTPWVHWETFTDYFVRLGGRLDYIHFVDSDGSDQNHFPLGEGNMPVEALVKVIRRYGYNGWLTNEMLSPYFCDPELYAAREIRSIRQVLKEVDEV